MNNRLAFIDFVGGLLNINPLERWSPQQAKLHPFITQAKFTGPFVPPMNLKSSSLTKSPAPGVQQQQQAEALSKQRQQAAQQAAHVSSQAAYNSMQMTQPYPPSNYAQGPPVYGNVHAQQQLPTPPYPNQPPAIYGHQMGNMHPQQMQTAYGGQQPQQPSNLYAQATTRAGRQRAQTIEQHGGVPAAIQRVASHLDPNAPIRLQPSPAYYPPPPGSELPDNTPGASRRRGSRAAAGAQQRSRNFVQSLEDRTMEEGFMNQSSWH